MLGPNQYPISLHAMALNTHVEKTHHFSLPTSFNQSTGSMSTPSRREGPHKAILASPPPKIIRDSIGTIGDISIYSLPTSTGTTDTNGFVYRPTAVVLSDEYYFSRMTIKKPLELKHKPLAIKHTPKRTSSFSRLKELSGRFVKRSKDAENKK